MNVYLHNQDDKVIESCRNIVRSLFVLNLVRQTLKGGDRKCSIEVTGMIDSCM